MKNNIKKGPLAQEAYTALKGIVDHCLDEANKIPIVDLHIGTWYALDAKDQEFLAPLTKLVHEYQGAAAPYTGDLQLNMGVLYVNTHDMLDDSEALPPEDGEVEGE